MTIHAARLPRLLTLAVGLLLILPATVFATSTTTAETLTVGSTLSITGIPAAVSYGTAFAGDTAYADSVIDVHASGNVATGTTLTVDATDLTAPGANGTVSIPASQREWNADPFDTTGQFHAFDAPGTAQVVGTNPVAGAMDAHVTLRVNIPANALAGDYTGTITWTLTANP